MQLWAEIFSTAGVRLGLVDLVSLQSSQKLDSVGSFKASVAAGNPNNEALMTIGRRAHLYFHDGNRKQFISQGILQKRHWVDAEGQHVVRWSGADALEELRQINTGAGLVFHNESMENAVTELLRLMTVRWSATIDSGIGNTSIRFDSVSVYRAIFSIALKKGLHMRLGNTPNRIDLGAMGVDTGLRLTNTGMIARQMHMNAKVVLVESLELVSDAFELYNWVVPLAGAGAEAALTLEDCTLSDPYTVESEVGPDGRTLYFVQDSTSVASYGKIQKVLMAQDLVPVRAEFEAVRNGANVLYEWATSQLSRAKDPHVSYRARIRNIKKIIRPGDQVRLSYQGQVWQFGQVVSVANINALFWVVGIDYSIDDTGLSAQVELSSVDINAVDASAVLADGMVALRDGQVGVQLSTQKMDDVQAIHAVTLVTNAASVINLQFSESAVSLVKARMAITRPGYPGADTLLIDVDNQRYAIAMLAGGKATNTETIDIRRLLIDRTKSGVDIQDEHEIVIHPFSLDGDVVVAFDIVEQITSVLGSEITNKVIGEFSTEDNDVGLADGTNDGLAQTFNAAEDESYFGAMFRLRRVGSPLIDALRTKVYSGEFDGATLRQVVEGSASGLVYVNEFETYYKDRFFHPVEMPTLAAGDYSVRLMPEIVAGLVAAWDLDEASGERIDWYRGHHLQDKATVTQAAGPGGETPAALFTAANSEYLSIDDNADLSFTAGMTIRFKLYLTTTGQYYLISKWNTTGDQRSYAVFIDGSNKLNFSVSDDGTSGGVTTVTSTGALSGTTWYDCEVWYDGAEIGVRIDGAEDTASFSADIFDGSADFVVGALNGASNFLNGRMAMLRAYGAALSDAQMDAVRAGDASNYLQIAAGDDITEDMVSLWPMEESISGAGRQDVWDSNHLTDVNGVTQVAGRVGNAAQFVRASTQYQYINDNESLSITGAITIAGWILLDSLPGAIMAVAAKSQFSGQESYHVYINPADQVVFQTSADGTANSTIIGTTFGALSTATWYFFAARFDGSFVRLRVNDVDQTPVAAASTIFNSTARFQVGAWNNTGAVPFNGRIDELAIWRRHLADAELVRLYNSGAGMNLLTGEAYRYGRLLGESGGSFASEIMDADFRVLRR